MGFDYIIEDIEDADIGIYYVTSIVKKNRNKIETVKELPNKFKVKSRAEAFVKKEIKKPFTFLVSFLNQPRSEGFSVFITY